MGKLMPDRCCYTVYTSSFAEGLRSMSQITLARWSWVGSMSHSSHYLATLFIGSLGEKLGNLETSEQSQGREECSTTLKSSRIEKSTAEKSRVKKSSIASQVLNEQADTGGLVDLLDSIIHMYIYIEVDRKMDRQTVHWWIDGHANLENNW